MTEKVIIGYRVSAVIIGASTLERYLIQCPLFGVSVKRDSTVIGKKKSFV